MNRRIRELAMQADIWCDQNYPNNEFYDIRWEEKFAELIVRESIHCCEQAISDPVPDSVDTWLNGGEQCIQEIKQHFGVKE